MSAEARRPSRSPCRTWARAAVRSAPGTANGIRFAIANDPVRPSTDRAYANRRNEVWLDLTTDTQGAGSATAAPRWAFDELTPPRSLVLHAERTRTAAGVAGTAGERVACLTLPAA